MYICYRRRFCAYPLVCPHGEENGNGFTALYQVHPLPLSTAILQVLYTTNCCDQRGRRLEYFTDRRYAQLSCRILKERYDLYWFGSLEAVGSSARYCKFQLLHGLQHLNSNNSYYKLCWLDKGPCIYCTKVHSSVLYRIAVLSLICKTAYEYSMVTESYPGT
jgi:hypothetical protein